ncbi:MAG: hypothetical protein LBH16_09490, partial [Treponema sp.]|nr:hypothetical protein [Treponema sp.]
MNVLLVDDHPMVNSGLAFCLEETGRFTVTGQANSLAEAKNFTALKMGALGYISKSGNKTELLNAIEAVLRGEIYISGEHSEKVMKSYGIYSKFTKREMEILNLIKINRVVR